MSVAILGRRGVFHVFGGNRGVLAKVHPDYAAGVRASFAAVAETMQAAE